MRSYSSGFDYGWAVAIKDFKLRYIVEYNIVI